MGISLFLVFHTAHKKEVKTVVLVAKLSQAGAQMVACKSSE
jgi:hypothetical protein